MKKVGLYFGSFNPIHNGHISLANYLVDNGLVDELWLVVSPTSPFKQNKQQLSAENRIFLAKKAISGNNRIKICDVELSLPQPNYTIDTLNFLREKYADCDFLLVMGADNVSGFCRWKLYDEIAKRHKILVYPRAGSEIKDLSQNMQLLENVPLFEFSSTEIREKIIQNKDISELVPAVIKEDCLRLFAAL